MALSPRKPLFTSVLIVDVKFAWSQFLLICRAFATVVLEDRWLLTQDKGTSQVKPSLASLIVWTSNAGRHLGFKIRRSNFLHCEKCSIHYNSWKLLFLQEYSCSVCFCLQIMSGFIFCLAKYKDLQLYEHTIKSHAVIGCNGPMTLGRKPSRLRDCL